MDFPIFAWYDCFQSCSGNISDRETPEMHKYWAYAIHGFMGRTTDFNRERKPMAETIRFEGLSLPVSDVARSVAFYQQFGFQVEQYGPMFALLRLGEGT